MNFLRNLPIKRKLMVITMLVSGAALVVASLGFIVFEQSSARKQMLEALEITAAMTAANSTAGLSFDEADSVEQTLKSLSVQPDIVQACVYNKDGHLFAQYLRNGGKATVTPLIEGTGYRFDSQRLKLFQPISLAGETIGTIYLEEDLSQLTERLWRCSIIGLIVLVACTGVAFLLSVWLQSVISGPIWGLARTVAMVRSEKNYSIRAVKQGNDELGHLIDGFNEMLAQIQERDINLERRVAERTQELAESISVLNATLGSTADGILVVNAQGQKIFQNRRTVEIWKIPPEIATGTDDNAQVDFVINATLDPAKFAKRVAFFYANPEERGRDEIQLKDGTIIERITAPVLDREGLNYGRIWTFRDVTQSRKYEAALRESEANYYSLVDQMPAGVFRVDKDGRYVFVNSWFCRFMGASPQDFLGRLPQEVAVGQSGDENESDTAILALASTVHHANIMQTGQQIECDEKHITPDGKKIYFHALKSPVYGANGAVVGSQGILLDITQRKLAEAELAYERDLLRTLLESSTDSIYFKDLESRFIKSSNYQAQKFGLTSADELIGKTDFDFFSDEHARPAYEDEQQIISSGQPMIGKIERIFWKDGRQESWMLTTKMPFRNNAGEVIGTFGISKDITPIKEAEARLEAAHRQLLETSRLAGMAEVATSVLHNVGNVLNSVNVSTTLVVELIKKSRLNNLGKVAAMINEQRDNLATFFTSDPRGSRLPGYLVTLTEHLVTEHLQLTNEIELTRKNIEHIKDIVTMQQSYAKVSGVVEKVKVTDLVEDALRMNSGALTRHHVQLIRDYPEETIEFNTERQKVLQILVNLIRNAKYACDESDRPDKCLIMQIRASNGHVQIITIDNGVGIPPENLTRIFNHGFTTRDHGHGFGLHSGALAAKELGGSLTAYSEGDGAGARFVLELPLQSA